MINEFSNKSVCPHILVVEDDFKISLLLKSFFESNSFICSLAEDSEHARKLLEVFRFDLALVDVMLPGENGIELTEYIVHSSDTPVIILSAKKAVESRISGLEAGADDYVSKPFNPQEVLLRVKAVLKRSTQADIKCITLGDYTFDLNREELSKAGSPVNLSAADKTILGIMAVQSNRTISREEICRMVKTRGETITGRTVDLRIYRLRKKLKDDTQVPKYLKTVRGRGYVLVPDEIEFVASEKK